MKRKVVINEEDRFKLYLKDQEEVIEMFGEDYLEEYGIELDDTFIAQYKEVYSKYKDLQHDLREILKKAGR
jgi:hypothetical protein